MFPLESALRMSLNRLDTDAKPEHPQEATPTPRPTPTIWAAIVDAQRHVARVEKTSLNKFQGWKYAPAESLIDAARQALGMADLALVTTGWEATGDRLTVRYLLAHSSGHTWEFASSTPIVVDKGRTPDKAEATALTYNLSYFLRGLLLIPRVEEGTEVNARDDRPAPTTPATLAKAGPLPAVTVDVSKWAARISEAHTVEALHKVGSEIGRRVPEAQRGDLQRLYRDRLAVLAQHAANDGGAA